MPSQPSIPLSTGCFTLQCFEMALTDRNMQVRFSLNVSVYSLGQIIWVSSTSFQKSSIGWPQQPPTEKVQCISENLYFWWFIPQKKDHNWSFWCHWWSNSQDQEVFWGNRAVEAGEASEVAEAAEANEAAEVSKA